MPPYPTDSTRASRRAGYFGSRDFQSVGPTIERATPAFLAPLAFPTEAPLKPPPRPPIKVGWGWPAQARVLGPVGLAVGLLPLAIYIYRAASTPGSVNYVLPNPSKWNICYPPLVGGGTGADGMATHWRQFQEQVVHGDRVCDEHGTHTEQIGMAPCHISQDTQLHRGFAAMRQFDASPQLPSFYGARYRTEYVNGDFTSIALFETTIQIRPKLTETYTYPDDYPQLAPALTPGFASPVRYPNEVPELNPIMQPAYPHPQRWDEAVAEPGTQPSVDRPLEVPVRFPTVLPFPIVEVPQGWPTMPPAIDIGVGTPVQPAPGTPDTVTQPAPDLDVSVSRPTDTDVRVDARTKERKIQVKTGRWIFWWAFGNSTTEVFDFIGAMHDGLPPDCKTQRKKGKQLSPYEMLRDLYNCWEHFDVASAFAAFVNNQIEDMFVGFQGQQRSRFLATIGGTSGTGWDTRNQHNIDKALEDQGGNLDPVTLPTLEWNADFQRWEVYYGDTLLWWHK